MVEMLGFVTLTYSDEFLPENGSLVKKEPSKFMKDLRNDLPGRKLKYFACGEYGTKTDRAHYHAIIFGLRNNLEDRTAVYDNWQKCDRFQFFGSNWQKCYGTVTTDSCAYVAGYCQKKKFGYEAKELYEAKGRIAPFQVQSQHIGEQYFLDNFEQIVKDGYILYNGVRCSIPETFKRKYGLNYQDSDYMLSEKLSYFNDLKKRYGEEFEITIQEFFENNLYGDLKYQYEKDSRILVKAYLYANKQFREQVAKL